MKKRKYVYHTLMGTQHMPKPSWKVGIQHEPKLSSIFFVETETYEYNNQISTHLSIYPITNYKQNE